MSFRQASAAILTMSGSVVNHFVKAGIGERHDLFCGGAVAIGLLGKAG
jgi:hypothetical protein